MTLDGGSRSRLWEHLTAADEGEMPHPWRRVQLPRIGGAFAAGLNPEGTYLLLVSSSGRGVIDCRSGKRVARDDSPDGDWLDTRRRRALGIGPLAGQEIYIAGTPAGGGLPTRTDDGWTLHRATPEGPREIIWCEGPGQPGSADGTQRLKLWDWDAPFAWGFSRSGTAAVIACSNEVRVWTRP